ncbi:hypothetical protein [Salinisphaera sp. Q1T1-3]|uniref:hypothetical protein n=1 Tax=Salinisphaera sp. Q1T1-3 TaxID=2321229 RepID=UPI000E714DCC|nr:hypothetical protein [Salinisphaera sp. Q1T1-3]RJS94734.1 hypothetical protein D3260_02865 [Salinisphaera sp. Q1T1-3]
MQIRKWLYQRFWGGRSAKETPVVLFVAGDVALEQGRVPSILEASFETDVYRSDDSRLAENGQLHADPAIGQLVARSRAPVMVFVVPDELRAEDLGGLIERFQPARALWWYEDYRCHLREMATRPNARLSRTRLRHLLADDNVPVAGRLPESLHALARNESTLDESAVHALLWYARHVGFREAGLAGNRAIHLYSGAQLRLTPKETLTAMLESAGIGTAVLDKTRFDTSGQRVEPVERDTLPEALEEACRELQDWLDRHASH